MNNNNTNEKEQKPWDILAKKITKIMREVIEAHEKEKKNE
tara:strand:+ start:83 stop:202 length:120 start_codon:yes stop_codon:yes gene_type:complete